MSAFVEFKNVSKCYRTGEVEIHALRDVNFQIEQGEFCIIVGASGALLLTAVLMWDLYFSFIIWWEALPH